MIFVHFAHHHKKKEQPHHPAELLLCTRSSVLLQVHQGAGLGTPVHDVLILDAQQIPLGNHDIDVPHQARDTIQIQAILQLHLSEGMAAGVGADPYRGGDSHFLCSVLQHPSNCLIREGLACFTEEKVPVQVGHSFR